jgi:type I restriction enzyme, S subunit
MSEWKEYRFSDFAYVNPQVKLQGESTYSFVEMKDLTDGQRFCKPSQERALSGGTKFQSNDTLFARITPCLENGKICQVKNLKNGVGFGSTEFHVFRGKEGISDTNFIFYLSRWSEVRNFAEKNFDGTSGRQRVPRVAFDNLFINLPEISEQKAIATILSSIDDKIDLLHRQNATLEAMAETLFRQWFVEEAKEDWEEKFITAFFEVRDGTHDSPKQKAFGKPLITSKHISDNKIDIESAYLISEEDFINVNKRSKVDTSDILFSMIGTIGLIYFEQSKSVNYAIKNIGLFKTSQNPIWRYYTYLWLKSQLGKDFIHEQRSGSTQEYISLGSLRSITFNVPPEILLNKFNTVASTYFEKIKTNQTQIRTLTTLRDTLLPKLMSGEIRVKY